MTDHSVDPFIVAWGETSAWQGAAHQATLVSMLPPSLIQWNAVGVFQVAHALAQTQALRHYLVNQIDQMVEKLQAPFLHRGMSELRQGSRGWLKKWRRHCIKHAVSLGSSVQIEHVQLAEARVQLEAWGRALDHAHEGLAIQSAWMQDNIPPLHEKQWEELQAQVHSGMEGVSLLKTHVGKLLDGVQCLRRKAALYEDVCNALPSHEDMLTSPSFNAIVQELLRQPCSSLAISRE